MRGKISVHIPYSPMLPCMNEHDCQDVADPVYVALYFPGQLDVLLQLRLGCASYMPNCQGNMYEMKVHLQGTSQLP